LYDIAHLVKTKTTLTSKILLKLNVELENNLNKKQQAEIAQLGER
jgi:hypothetical protein